VRCADTHALLQATQTSYHARSLDAHFSSPPQTSPPARPRSRPGSPRPCPAAGSTDIDLTVLEGGWSRFSRRHILPVNRGRGLCVAHVGMYTPPLFTLRHRQYSCGRKRYDMRPTRVKCEDERSVSVSRSGARRARKSSRSWGLVLKRRIRLNVIAAQLQSAAGPDPCERLNPCSVIEGCVALSDYEGSARSDVDPHGG
jgi:hypothetical protein